MEVVYGCISSAMLITGIFASLDGVDFRSFFLSIFMALMALSKIIWREKCE